MWTRIIGNHATAPALPAASQTERLANIQALRGVAALLVATLHLTYASTGAANAYARYLALKVLPTIGHFGVDVFFVISGFIIALQVGRGQSALRFAWRRAFRIFPLFWLALAAAILAQWMAGTPAVWPPITQLLLFDFPPALDVSWTLVFEVQFYAAATVALLFGRRAPQALLAWCCLQTIIVGIHTTGALPDYSVLRPITLEFVAGTLIGFSADKIRVPRPRVVLLGALVIPAAVALLIGWRALYLSPVGRPLVCGTCACLVLSCAITLERRGVKAWPPLVRLGDISYSLYMWHSPLFVALAFWFGPFLHKTLGVAAFLIVGMVAALAVAAVSFTYIERPLNRWASRTATW